MNPSPTFASVGSIVRRGTSRKGAGMPVGQAEIESIMNHFAESQRGGRCQQCGFEWRTSFEDASSLMRRTPGRYREIIRGHFEQARTSATGTGWSPNEYVWHVADAV